MEIDLFDGSDQRISEYPRIFFPPDIKIFFVVRLEHPGSFF